MRILSPAFYNRVQYVNSFHELVSLPFANGINAICWQRELRGNFDHLAALLQTSEPIRSVSPSILKNIPLDPDVAIAARNIIADYELLENHGLEPSFDCITAYPRDEEESCIRTDVYSFHADSAEIEASTFLCTYSGESSEVIRNEDAIRKIDIPAIQDSLLNEYGGDKDDAFDAFVKENCFHLHYKELPDAQTFALGTSNLWRIAIDYPGCPVPPCIHRAPSTGPGSPPRLLLIS